MTRHQLPIIITNWNGSHDTIECIDSILSASIKEIKVTIHIWDNDSINTEKEVLRNYVNLIANCKLYESDENIGFTSANNILFGKILNSQITSTGFILCLNNDAIIHKNFFKGILTHLDKASSDMVSCHMVQYFDRTKSDNKGHFILSNGEILPIHFDEYINSKNCLPHHIGPCAGAAIYSIDMLKDIGTFDEHFNTGYEDAELSLRATLEGYKTTYEPKAIVYHKGGMSIKSIFDIKFAITEQTNILYTIYKLYPLIILPFITLFLMLRVVIILILAVCFFKTQIAKVLLKSYILFFTKIISIALKNRLSNRLDILKALKILRIQASTLCFDTRRFTRIIVGRNSSAVESY